MNLRDFWTFLVTEKLGYHRPSPITPVDAVLRHLVERRHERLEQLVSYIDATVDVVKMGRHHE